MFKKDPGEAEKKHLKNLGRAKSVWSKHVDTP